MLFRSYTPVPPLCDFIDRFWLAADTPHHSRERILPSGTIELVINLRDDEVRIYNSRHPNQCKRFSGAVASGAYGEFFLIDPSQHASILGVHFKPGGAYPFLGIPAGELADTHVDLETLWGPSAIDLREQLCTATSPAERFALLEHALITRLRQADAYHEAVPIALAAFGRGAKVFDVARLVDLSHRQFVHVFKSHVGLTPKLYSRVQRFQQVKTMVRTTPPDWAKIAVAAGYFDQSHLIRDFHTFSGFSPTDYIRHQSEHVLLNHVPDAQ